MSPDRVDLWLPPCRSRYKKHWQQNGHSLSVPSKNNDGSINIWWGMKHLWAALNKLMIVNLNDVKNLLQGSRYHAILIVKQFRCVRTANCVGLTRTLKYFQITFCQNCSIFLSPTCLKTRTSKQSTARYRYLLFVHKQKQWHCNRQNIPQPTAQHMFYTLHTIRIHWQIFTDQPPCVLPSSLAIKEEKLTNRSRSVQSK